jgi:predicted DNA-binding transcriptional regulator YafY
MAEIHPEDTELAAAVHVIGERILTGVPQRPDSDIGRTLAQAIRDRRAITIQYSRAWKPGLVERTVHPLRLVETARGWELDAMLPAEGLRTFILERIRDMVITDTEFEVPPGINEDLAQHRRPTTVDLVVPHGYQWAVDRFAESSVVMQEDEGDVSIRAQFLPPVAERVGLVIITAPDSLVVRPASLQDAGHDMAGRLLAHHGLA